MQFHRTNHYFLLEHFILEISINSGIEFLLPYYKLNFNLNLRIYNYTMTVRILKIFFLLCFSIYFRKSKILKETDNMEKLQRKLMDLSPNQQSFIQKKLRSCRGGRKCRREILMKGLEMLFSKKKTKKQRKLKSIHMMYYVHISFVILFIFFMLTYPFMGAMLLSAAVLLTVLKVIVAGGRVSRKLAENGKGVNPLRVKNYLHKNFDTLMKKERKNLYYYFKENPVHLRSKLTEKKLAQLTRDYFEDVYDQKGVKLNKNIASIAHNIVLNQKKIMKKLIRALRK